MIKINILVFVFSLLFVSCQEKEVHPDHKHDEVFYTCSMHPQIKEKEPGKCPICGMGLTRIQKTQTEAKASQKPYYYCESDPSVKSLHEGVCPLDGRPMQKFERGKKKLQVRPHQIKHLKVGLFKVQKKKLKRKIRLLGTVLKSEQGQSNIPSRVRGRVEEVLVRSTGSFIRKGDPVLKIYSPLLLTGAEEYLIARANHLKNKKSKAFRDIYEQSTERLKQWGIRDAQLQKWAQERKVPREVTIYSPVTGIVENRSALVGKYFKEGESYFDLVDLSQLWVELDVYEHESGLVNLGQDIELEFSAYPGEYWHGKLDFVSPLLNEKSRTLKLRTTLENTNGKLRPGMTATAKLSVASDKSTLVIPQSAVIDTGRKKIVWLDKGGNQYESHPIITGFSTDEFVEVKNGLKEGDLVVTKGNFLLDAQSQLFGVDHAH